MSAGASEVLAAPHLRARGAEHSRRGGVRSSRPLPRARGAERRTFWEGAPEPPRGAFASGAVTPISQRVLVGRDDVTGAGPL